MTRDQMLAHLRAADAVARDAAAHGHHPFGAVLVGPDDAILMRQGNIDTVRHAETELARRAAAAYPPEFLWTCTLVSTGEPCAMCTGTLYWANIGRLVYGFEETKLLALTGDHAGEPDDEPLFAHRTRLRPEKDRGPWPLPRDRGRADRPAPRFLEALTRWLRQGTASATIPAICWRAKRRCEYFAIRPIAASSMAISSEARCLLPRYHRPISGFWRW